jgi:16S rRNA (cytosine1402-N4)-methyltransferase
MTESHTIEIMPAALRLGAARWGAAVGCGCAPEASARRRGPEAPAARKLRVQDAGADAPKAPSRRPVFFSPAWRSSLGTGMTALLAPVVARASGWLRGLPPVPPLNQVNHAPGTARPLADMTGARSEPGWLSERSPASFSQAPPTPAESYHIPVLTTETTMWMAAREGDLIIDGTLGGGGHSERFLQAGARVWAIDQDPEALAHARERLARFGGRFQTHQGNFAELGHNPALTPPEPVDGLLLDLGVSSRQLDAPERGFSFMREGPLDMRMGPSARFTARELVNSWDESELIRIFREYGEEPAARRIAAAIVQRRQLRPFDTTTDLANHIEQTTGRHGKTHPATRTFQALRMAVNGELEALERVMQAAPALLKPGGRLLIITFHSLEDRLVKRFLRERSTALLDQPEWPAPRPNPLCQFSLPHRKAIAASPAETLLNPRARSAKLRVAIRL